MMLTYTGKYHVKTREHFSEDGEEKFAAEILLDDEAKKKGYDKGYYQETRKGNEETTIEVTTFEDCYDAIDFIQKAKDYHYHDSADGDDDKYEVIKKKDREKFILKTNEKESKYIAEHKDELLQARQEQKNIRKEEKAAAKSQKAQPSFSLFSKKPSPDLPQVKFCTKCGNEVLPNTKFCTKCGNAIA